MKGSIIMALIQNTGIYPVFIYEYIKNNSDKDKTLSVNDIVNELEKHITGIKIESIKKTVERNLSALILYDENIHIITKNGTEDYIPYESKHAEIKEIYYDQPLTTGDIRILSDAVVYSNHLRKKDKEELLNKLSNIYPSHSNNWYANAIHDSADSTVLESDLFRNLEYIDQAITQKSCIDFDYMWFDSNQKLHKRDTIKSFVPLKIYISNDTYFVIGITKSSRNMHNVFSARKPGKKELPYLLKRYEIYKIRRLFFNYESEYINISKTSLSKKNLKEICDDEYSEFNHLHFYPKIKSRNIQLLSTQFGLQKLIPLFGSKIKAKKIEALDLVEKYPTVLEHTPSNENLYIVTLKEARVKEWTTLLSVLYEHPINLGEDHYHSNDIVLLSHHDKLSEILGVISKNLEIPDLGNPDYNPESFSKNIRDYL